MRVIFLLFVCVVSRHLQRTSAFRKASYRKRRLGRACSHGFAPREKKECCDHLADKTKFQPLRIKTSWSLPANYNAKYSKFLTECMVEATNYWMFALKVHRSADNLYREESGNIHMNSASWYYYPDDGSGFWKLKKGWTKEHFKTELRKSFKYDSFVFPPEMHHEVVICEFSANPRDRPRECETIPKATGIAADLVVGVVLDDNCGFWAGATSVSRDKCGRPITGAVVICTKSIEDLFTKERYIAYTLAERKSTYVAILIHELSHILAFSSLNWERFRSPDGSAMVPHGDSGALDAIAVPYQNSQNQVKQVIYVDLTAHNILKAVPYFGHDTNKCKCVGPGVTQECFAHSSDKNKPPSCVFVVTTPKVKAAAREFFGCDSVEGMPLENRPTVEYVTYGGHWENRAVGEGLMAATVTVSTLGKFISNMTLALMEDSGWYVANYSLSTKLVEGVHWGYKAGCAFLTQKCGENHPAQGYFCKQGEQSCSRGLRQKVECRNCAPGKAVLPEVWQFFPDEPTKICGSGGNCPIFKNSDRGLGCSARSPRCRTGFCQGVRNGKWTGQRCQQSCRCAESLEKDSDWIRSEWSDCRLSGLRTAETWQYGETTGEESYCFMSTWSKGRPQPKHLPRCFAVKCAADKQSYEVYMVKEHHGTPVPVGVCSSAADTIDPLASLGSPKNGAVGGSVACHAPEYVCMATNDIFNGLDFSRGPVVRTPTITKNKVTPGADTIAMIVMVVAALIVVSSIFAWWYFGKQKHDTPQATGTQPPTPTERI
eukprot:GEMP01014918.1.p1 GENE.GEMP01014918.1~~GEMP01014918.1.p1  ORF type:complete len:771 (-),score=120.02 GEMP01014918.1:563-2875(-)